MYTEKDISVVIPTYNRVEDLGVTLKDLGPFFPKVREVLVVDQSKTQETCKLVKSLKFKNLKYIFSETPSITIARNLGVKNAGNSKIICFIDDDVSLGKNYFSEILKVFNSEPEALAVSGYVKEESMKNINRLEHFIKKIFFLAHLEKNKARIVSSYGNTYPLQLDKTINAQWLQGANMVYKREVFQEHQFDENLLGYTIAEDTGFTYKMYKKHPNSIFVTPFAELKHRYSQVERYPTRKMSYINQVDHFYFNFKEFNGNAKEKLIFAWSLFGILVLRVLNVLKNRRKIDVLKLKFFLESLEYCLRNLGKIRKGKVREFDV